MDRDSLLQPATGDTKQELVDLLTNQLNAIRNKLKEIRAQIDQMSISVEKEQTRYSGIATDLRAIQDNLDTVPRDDIRDKYDEALNVRFRLATMRGQLEKFEAQYGYLEEQQEFLNNILSKIQGFEAFGGDEEHGEVTSQGGANIIRIIQAQEEERQRLARQIHDGPAQSMTNFILQVDICQKLFDRDPTRAAEELNTLKENASKTFQKIRDFIFDLRPMMLDDLGVVPTVRRYIDSFKEKNDINAELEIVGDERRLENHREVLIFRSIQDLMGLARDYANPTRVKVRLNITSDPIRIMVEDDGRGFDASAVFSDEEETHHDARVQGLVTLREKYELVGGTISVESSEDAGTTIRLELPKGGLS